MLTLNDIINVNFRKMKFSGYNTEDVDAFIDQVESSYDALIKKSIEQKEKNEALAAENAELLKKLEVLADRIEEYRKEEDQIKSALVSAQKLGDASIREARHKAEIILKDANLKAEHVVDTAKAQIIEEQKELEQLKKTVSDFRSKLLETYKEHLTLINALPAQKEPENKVPEPQEEESLEPEQEKETPPTQPVEEVEPEENLEATREFGAVSFEAEKVDVAPEPVHDRRYDVLKFGDDYDISSDR